MSSKSKPDGSSQMKLKRGTSPLDGGKKMPIKSASSAAARRETSPGPASSRSQVTSHLKSSMSSRTEGAKPLKKPGHESTPKPSVNRRSSLDKPPVAAPQVKMSLSSGSRERGPTSKSLLPTYKTALTGKKPTGLGTNKTVSKPKPVTERGKVVSKTAKRTPSPNNIVKKDPQHSDLVEVPEVNDLVVVVNDTQDVGKESVKDVDHYEEIEDQADNDAALHHQETGLIEDEESEKSVAGEFKDDDLLEHHEDILVNNENGDGKEQQEEEAPAESEALLLDEKIEDIEHHDQEDYNDHEEVVESSDETEITEDEKKPNEPENKDDALTEKSDNGSRDEAESEKCSIVEVDVEVEAKVGEEINVEASKPNADEVQEEEAISARQVTVQPDGAVTTTILKSRRSMGKDSAVSNDVIAETATKLLEQRKNKVRALVGAFETVISLQEPEQ
ncbi:hypothetical protein SAY87_000703 [Trapa incisa]|uniref:Calmodulin-binding domain-containing protein n=1 Tax=Trapa incisa TaxID=236973 RepID=A0AAN7JGU2_9MYRT|nr:hypothetical protein SAY87_000703 [Trapa incisa]